MEQASVPTHAMPPSSPEEPMIQTPVQTPTSTKPKNWLLITLIILVILLSLGTAGFFAYQNYQLTHKTTRIKVTPTTSPSPTEDVNSPTMIGKHIQVLF